MKGKRQRMIVELIQTEIIGTQEELALRLRERGLEAAQATVSRDIKELGLCKVPISKDESRYALPADPAPRVSERLRGLLRDTVTQVDYSVNLVVVHTLPGHAHAVAAAFDSSHWEEVIGTVAGDDTILLVVKPLEAVEGLVAKINGWLHDES
ncbi:arginine repressor [Heliophilum fasciatum]|uniref:Arginine repressor n=1 Tax=Heliophilum fasciatum TaxID=35700 RepID=A0A4R2RUW4_9FIRM|nr:arginine repressor [Heliophilum fasciatum]MCW2277347.1 transcriptional regulator of arginine metabolism [Heliophilum fasciatum]TCP67184.1 ArgR family transcriptional regulator [Heliophilum fasciatum]